MRASSFFAGAQIVRAFVVVGALTLGLLAGCNSRRPTTVDCPTECGTTQLCCANPGSTTVGSCIARLSDTRNCGVCGHACVAGQICVDGSCTGGTLTDTGVPRPDAGDGGTGPTDGGGTGTCTASPACAAGFMCCGPDCIDADGVPSGMDGRADASFDDCGICGVACNDTSASRCGRPRGATSGRPVCLCGDFTACAAPRQCTLAAGEFRCIDPLGDDTACGTPTAVDCTLANQVCEAGTCVCAATGSACPTGQICGDTGCIDVTTDENNCGDIGRTCVAGEMCVGGVCHCGGASGPTCIPPSSGGGGTPFPIPGSGAACGELCCAGSCVPHDIESCGTCGTACSGTDVCGTDSDFLGMGGVDTTPHCGDPEGGGGFSFFSECTVGMPPADGGTGGTPCPFPGIPIPPGCI